MRSTIWQTREIEFFARTPEFEPLKGLWIPKSDISHAHPSHGCNILKLPGSGGVITVACQEKDAVCFLERAFQAAAVENPKDKDDTLPPEIAPKTKKLQLGQGSREEALPREATLSLASPDGAPSPIA